MRMLLLVSHGSRRTESNDEVRRLAEQVAQLAGPAFEKVACAFLELTSPMIDSAIAEMAGEGATEIVLFPFFLAAGTHVVNDIPRIIEEARGKFPDVAIMVISHLGAVPELSTLILNHVERSTSSSDGTTPC
ncbi:sirohydrochlorin cobaltochelatase [Desulfoluna limicola]|uniref:Sirohydrochlorin cobaltochelatase n=1 Tax=Desulfoluna limicola TaxID=2810562 RepID=A0ABM7PCH3_9BACT|nr:CbiX/SirB N-terminal domain-containing protein [Desulfoluna limicola]BCS95357.1 sirohydrochlorin cobaltochelatase [Desulfoluna limicola]